MLAKFKAYLTLDSYERYALRIRLLLRTMTASELDELLSVIDKMRAEVVAHRDRTRV